MAGGLQALWRAVLPTARLLGLQSVVSQQIWCFWGVLTSSVCCCGFWETETRWRERPAAESSAPPGVFWDTVLSFYTHSFLAQDVFKCHNSTKVHLDSTLPDIWCLGKPCVGSFTSPVLQLRGYTQHRRFSCWKSHVLDTYRRMTAPVPYKNNLKGLFIANFRQCYSKAHSSELWNPVYMSLQSFLKIKPKHSVHLYTAFSRLFLFLGCWVHFLSLLTTAHPAIKQLLYYYALWQNLMQPNTGSKQETTTLVNKPIVTSGALGRDSCSMCYPNQLKQPCSNFRRKLHLLLYVRETLLYTLRPSSSQISSKMLFRGPDSQFSIITSHHNCLPQNSCFPGRTDIHGYTILIEVKRAWSLPE